MLTADLRHALLSAADDAGYPAPGHDPVLRSGGAPGRYTAGFPLRIIGQHAPAIAEAIAAPLRATPWIATVTSAPRGYLIITVTDEALQRLAVRVAEAGPACVRSDALRGTPVPPPPGPSPLPPSPAQAPLPPPVPLPPLAPPPPLEPRPSGAPLQPPTSPVSPAPPAGRPDPWAGAHAAVLLQVTAALGRAAGASVPFNFFNRLPPHPVPTAMAPDPVTAAEAFAGAEAIRYTLARTPPGRLVAPDPAAVARHVEANPAYAVRYAYSCAASTLRWAAALGLSRGGAAGFRPDSLAHPRERALLDALSWLPEQVARAARRGRPHEFTAFLEGLAETYQVCRVACPAWPERGHVVRARLWLTGAAAAGLAAGLELLGVSAPDRL
jgi:arginyl-tRNA synthetase